MDRTFPRFLDFEASSLSPDSYPIEIAWSDASGRIHSHLINPSSVPWWTDWSEEAQAVHGITRNDLLRDGRDPVWLCARFAREIHGESLFSDVADFDERWLRELFRGANLALPDVRVASVGQLELIRGIDHVTLARLKREARTRAGAAHRAGRDVAYLLELYRLAEAANGA